MWEVQIQSADGLWLVFLVLITGTVLSEFHLTTATITLPLFYPHSYG